MEEKYPTIIDRIKSILIDSIIIIACMMIISEILNAFKNVPDWVRIVLFMAILLYEPLCTVFGATLGNHKMEIRVRKNSDSSKRLNIFQSLIRYFFKIIFGWFSFLGIFTNSKNRAIHDLISGSVMIKA